MASSVSALQSAADKAAKAKAAADKAAQAKAAQAKAAADKAAADKAAKAKAILDKAAADKAAKAKAAADKAAADKAAQAKAAQAKAAADKAAADKAAQAKAAADKAAADKAAKAKAAADKAAADKAAQAKAAQAKAAQAKAAADKAAADKAAKAKAILDKAAQAKAAQAKATISSLDPTLNQVTPVNSNPTPLVLAPSASTISALQSAANPAIVVPVADTISAAQAKAEQDAQTQREVEAVAAAQQAKDKEVRDYIAQLELEQKAAADKATQAESAITPTIPSADTLANLGNTAKVADTGTVVDSTKLNTQGGGSALDLTTADLASWGKTLPQGITSDQLTSALKTQQDALNKSYSDALAGNQTALTSQNAEFLKNWNTSADALKNSILTGVDTKNQAFGTQATQGFMDAFKNFQIPTNQQTGVNLGNYNDNRNAAADQWWSQYVTGRR